jgi:hypothetical protein
MRLSTKFETHIPRGKKRLGLRVFKAYSSRLLSKRKEVKS